MIDYSTFFLKLVIVAIPKISAKTLQKANFIFSEFNLNKIS